MSKEQPIEVRDMAIVHRAFRDGFAEGAQLVRAARAPSAERVKFLADHFDFGIMMLHLHHEGEDELLYPKLIGRAPEQAPMIEGIEQQHKQVQAALDVAEAACRKWREQPSPETAEALASAIDDANAVAQSHLDDEEEKIVPLAAVTVTQEEWDALGKHGVALIPRNKMPIAFGMLLDPLDAADRAYMKKSLPTPVRWLYPVLIDRPWRKYASTLRNGS